MIDKIDTIKQILRSGRVSILDRSDGKYLTDAFVGACGESNKIKVSDAVSEIDRLEEERNVLFEEKKADIRIQNELNHQLQIAAENICIQYGCPLEVYEGYDCQKDCSMNIMDGAACWRKYWSKKTEGVEREDRIELENKLLTTEKERDEAIAKAAEYEKEICDIEVKCCACYARVRNLKAALEKIIKEDENDTTYEENFGNALHIARQALREWKEPKIAHKKAKSPHA